VTGLNLKFGLDLATLLLAATVAGSVSIVILSEVVKRIFKSDKPIQPENASGAVQTPSVSAESKRNFKISFGDRSYVITVEELQGVAILRPEIAEPSQRVEPEVSVPQDATKRAVKAPLPGVVLSVRCQPGETVAAGRVLLTLEAMKMENEITAPAAGLVKRIMVREGQTVEHGQILVELG